MPVRNSRGTAMVEFALILPVLLVLGFAIVDFGLLIQARLIITNVAREGGDSPPGSTRPLQLKTI